MLVVRPAVIMVQIKTNCLAGFTVGIFWVKWHGLEKSGCDILSHHVRFSCHLVIKH